MNRRGLIQKIRTYGFFSSLYYLVFWAINRIVEFNILYGFYIEEVDPAYLEGPPQYRYGFLGRDELLGMVRDPRNYNHQMSEAFIHDSFSKGDECYGIVDGSVLAGYGWYSTQPTAISDDLRIHFQKDYVYMFRGLTRPEYRGQRLHAIGMTRALKHYKEHGFRGLISYVESVNFQSLKSVYRMGYKYFGKIYVLKVAGRYWIHSDAGCRAYRFYLEEVSKAATTVQKGQHSKAQP
jgi:hypothetical protein